MMITALLFGAVAQQIPARHQRPKPQPAPVRFALSYDNGNFTVTDGTSKQDVSIRSGPKPDPLFVAFRKNQNWAVWDHRGLTIRAGEKAKSYRLRELSVSPRLFERADIRNNLTLFEKGDRSKDAGALSGAKRIGNDVYFLVRWDDKQKHSWLEALIRVPLDESKLAWYLVGKFDGMSLASKAVDNRLLLDNGSLAIINRKDDDWGESFYSSRVKGFGFKKLGSGLLDFREGKQGGGLFVEKTTYGTTLAGEINIQDASRHEELEMRAPFTLLDNDRPLLALPEGRQKLRNGASGSELSLPKDAGIYRCGVGVLVWWPGFKPTSAVLYDPERWTPLARWTGTGKPKGKTTNPDIEESPTP